MTNERLGIGREQALNMVRELSGVKEEIKEYKSPVSELNGPRFGGGSAGH